MALGSKRKSQIAVLNRKNSATYMDASVGTIDKLLDEGKIRGTLIRGQWRIYIDSMDDYLANGEADAYENGKLKRNVRMEELRARKTKKPKPDGDGATPN